MWIIRAEEYSGEVSDISTWDAKSAAYAYIKWAELPKPNQGVCFRPSSMLAGCLSAWAEEWTPPDMPHNPHQERKWAIKMGWRVVKTFDTKREATEYLRSARTSSRDISGNYIYKESSGLRGLPASLVCVELREVADE